MNDCDRDEFSARDWPQWELGSNPAPSKRWPVIVVWASLWLLFLIEPIWHAFDPGRPWWVRAVLLVDIVAYATCYVGFFCVGHRLTHANRVLAVLAATVLGCGIAALLGDPTELTFLTYAIVLALMLWPLRWSWLFGFGIAAVQVVLEWWLIGDVPWGNTSTLVLLTLMLGTFYRLINTTIMLRRAREEVRHLAVAEERSRLARDLHDVLGHSLTTITVKSGLARRVLESDADRERAIAEVRDVEDLSRQALAEVRATVSGYRKASLTAELVGARAALRAAGIAAELPHAVDDVRTPLREPFAYVLREAVTNVVRHSGASRCEVRFGASWIAIRDDGPAKVPTVDAEEDHGNGLSGLSERLIAVGGILTAGSAEGGGFLVRASVPEPTGPERAIAPLGSGRTAVGPA